eukprot:CAMPEP_0197049408 /NCGR_PEP_ID=MMETSP1384-20130603/24558_1 /TAXON_ID=29189 /ORGANISM="Ammonia sp." /LENGTH=486 /DNA_ID=CAMNT_0042481675 /DNA_START=92 /DNA_END=1552 /DNA_ORIENTATION=+
MEKLSNYINGRFVAPSTGKYIENFNPATDKLNNLIPDSDSRDVEAAIQAARAALPEWSKLHFKERAVYLDRIAAEMRKESNMNAFCRAEANDMGKPMAMFSMFDMNGAIDQFESYSRMIQSMTTPYYQMSDAVAFEHRNAVGIVGLITPWNFPLMLFCTKIAPAIVCGNVCVCKPSELSPTTAYLMTKLLDKVGLPRGVVNVVHGYGASAGEPIVSHPLVRAISFTGGSMTGMRISGIAAPKLKKLQLELGGKNACIVFDDCYFEETVAGAAMAAFFNTGQVCCSGSRLLVQRGIADKFVESLKRFVMENYTKKIGDPLDSNTMLGPLVSRGHFQKVKSYLELAKREGGRFVMGGKHGSEVMGGRFREGYWVEPTIVMGLDDKCRCAMEEIFGPVVTVHVFDTEEEALRIANQVDYGLAASVWSSDARRGQRVARELEAGSVWINCYIYQDGRMPFGGFKNSGVQRENGRHSIDFFTEMKSITSKL